MTENLTARRADFPKMTEEQCLLIRFEYIAHNAILELVPISTDVSCRHHLKFSDLHVASQRDFEVTHLLDTAVSLGSISAQIDCADEKQVRAALACLAAVLRRYGFWQLYLVDDKRSLEYLGVWGMELKK